MSSTMMRKPQTSESCSKESDFDCILLEDRVGLLLPPLDDGGRQTLGDQQLAQFVLDLLDQTLRCASRVRSSRLVTVS